MMSCLYIGKKDTSLRIDVEKDLYRRQVIVSASDDNYTFALLEHLVKEAEIKHIQAVLNEIGEEGCELLAEQLLKHLSSLR